MDNSLDFPFVFLLDGNHVAPVADRHDIFLQCTLPGAGHITEKRLFDAVLRRADLAADVRKCRARVIGD